MGLRIANTGASLALDQALDESIGGLFVMEYPLMFFMYGFFTLWEWRR